MLFSRSNHNSMCQTQEIIKTVIYTGGRRGSGFRGKKKDFENRFAQMESFFPPFPVAGCILDSAPPDVPPRNPSMSRLNGRPGGLLGSMDRDGDFEPSCLVRTPSGNVYIPSGKSRM